MGALIYILISLGITTATFLIALQLRGPISEYFGVTVVENRCTGSVNRWANRRLESYRQELEAERQAETIQTTTTGNAATSLINWVDHLISDRKIDRLRQEIIRTSLRTSQCRPVFK
ncbi:MAG: hypothetical protein WCI65_11800 [Synechococcaceae cyanobacterium ELA263]